MTGGLGGLGLLHLPQLVGGGLHQRPELGGIQVVEALARPVHDGGPYLVLVEALLGGYPDEPLARLAWAWPELPLDLALAGTRSG